VAVKRKREVIPRRSTVGRKALEAHEDERSVIAESRGLPFEDWALRNLKIRDENGTLVPFLLRDTQRKFNAILDEEMEKQGYVRMIVLKARKEGISSVIQGRALRDVIERPGWRAGVMAHEDASCAAIFDRARTMAANLPEGMKRTARKWNRKEISYKPPHDSGLEVNVAKGRGGWARGSDKHFVHLSEVGFWPMLRGESRAQGQFVAVANAVPRVPGTVVVLESTANGAGSEFHRLWKNAVDGKMSWRAVFFAWFDFALYRLPGKVPADVPSVPEWEKEEPQLRALGCDEEQLAWRRWKIAGDCAGDLDTFHQEYPSTPEEAFLATGTPVFRLSLIQERHMELERHERCHPTVRWSFGARGIPVQDGTGPLRLYRREDLDRKDCERFVVTADPAGSGASAPDPTKGDPGCAYVWDRRHNEQIAELHGYLEPEEFARQLFFLGALFAQPLIVCEAGPWGAHVISALQRLQYPRIYFREQFTDGMLMARTNYLQYGWVTSAQSKPQMIASLQQLWSEKAITIRSLECIQEHITFVKNGIRREAQSGCHDDRVIACAIYAMWSLQHPYVVPVRPFVKRVETCGMILEEMLKRGEGAGNARFRLW